MLRDCTITLKSQPKNLKSKIPAIVALPFTFVNLSKCEVIGNESNHNGGLILLNAHAAISESSFFNFKAGAIYSIAKPRNEVVI